MAGKLACVTALGMAAGAAAFSTPMAARLGMPATASKSAMMRPTLGAMPARLAPRLRMSSEPAAAATDVDEYFGIDGDGNKVKLTTSAKEKKYLDACNVGNILDNNPSFSVHLFPLPGTPLVCLLYTPVSYIVPSQYMLILS
jgi:hypothetical protein